MSFLTDYSELIYSLATALGLGLLIGAERERRKSRNGAQPPAAGLRTFAVVSLMGAVSFWLGGATLLSVTLAVVTGMTALSYIQTAKEDPGLTTEIALLLTLLLGAVSIKSPAVAAGLAVTLSSLLAARDPMHRFVKTILTGHEMSDALILAAATLIILPLMPNHFLGPFEAINPQKIWLVVILVLTISAAGHVASRLMGPQKGLPVAGFFSGFVSSAVTIAAMGAKAKSNPELHRPAVAGAILATIASLIKLAVVFATLSPATLSAMADPIVWAMLAATVYGLFFTLGAAKVDSTSEYKQEGHAFSLRVAFRFALVLTTVLVGVAAVNELIGAEGVLYAAALAGFADTQAAAASISSLVTAGKMAPHAAVLPVLLALGANTIVRIILAFTTGGKRYAMEVVPGLMLIAAAAVAGALWG